MIAPKESTPHASRAYTDASHERLYEEDTRPNADSPGLPPSAPGESFPSWLRHYDRSQALERSRAARSRSKALVGIMCMAGTLALLTVLCCVLTGLWEVRFSDVAIAVAVFGGWWACRELGR